MAFSAHCLKLASVIAFTSLFTLPASAEDIRSRSAFTQGSSTVRDLVVVLDPDQKPPQGSEVSVYLPVRFAYNSSALSQVAKRNLDVIAEAMLTPKLKAINFIVEGHTDASGSRSYNQALSLRRAQSAARYLGQKGVEAKRLAIRGHGEDNPLPNHPARAAEQRRVEFVRIF
ncbi:MAG: OmpA family protein [Cohaesibacter sp.]|jgi:outer membrane protein OmpA-like peptidoglycan-associated protein|nr:OmpA family protein [Cohaesibacter sp.]